MNITFTDIIDEQIEIGRRIVAEHAEIYTENTVNIIKTHISKMIREGVAALSDEENLFYRSVYFYWAYGTNVGETFYYDFYAKSHSECVEYVTFRNRFWYVRYLNNKQDCQLLDDKYQLYELLKPAFKRDVIKITSDEDYALFETFINKHPVFVIKPIDLGSARGVRKYDATNSSDADKITLFNALLDEAKSNKKNESWGRGRPSMVLEEVIEQAPSMAVFHPASLQVLRITTLNDGNGNIQLFRPWIKIGANSSFTAAAATDGLCVEIDEATGVICSDGYVENCKVYTNHPNTGIKFKGFQIPGWDEAVSLCKELAKKFPTLRYIGWDVALSAERGWCIVEANTQADFCIQMITGKGIKAEFEEMIGWHPEKQFWWQ